MNSKFTQTTLKLIKFCFLWGFVIITNVCNAQEMPDLLPHTPEATSLIQNVDYPINYSNGLPNISIAFHSETVQNVTIPLSISYRPGGFTASEKEGVAGLGWSLSTDIQITRTVRGLDDFRREYNEQYGYYYQDDGRQAFGYYNASSPTFEQRYWEALHEFYRGNVDVQPDAFYYSLLSGKSGKFYFQKTEGTAVQIVQIPYTGVKIQIITAPVSTAVKGEFKITDLDGTEYYYGSTYTELNTGNYSGTFYDDDYANNQSGYISTWKCYKIVTANKKANIQFTYENQTDTYSINGKDYIELYYDRNVLEMSYGVSIIQPTSSDILTALKSYPPNYSISSSILTDGYHETVTCPDYYKSTFYNYGKNGNYSVYNSPICYTRHSTGTGSAIVVPTDDGTESDNLVLEDNDLRAPVTIRKQERLRLKKIQFPNGYFQFSYFSSGQLQTVQITNSVSLNKTVNFYQANIGATNGNISSDPTYSSYGDGTTYYLDSIRVSSGGENQVYKFDYNYPQGFANYLKPYTTFSEYSSYNYTVLDGLMLDNMLMSNIPDGNGDARTFAIGKTYQGVDDYLSTVPYSTANSVIYGRADAGTISSIEYPTGLTDNFTWEANKVYGSPYNVTVGGLRIKEIQHKEGSSILLKRIFTYGRNDNGCGFFKKYLKNEPGSQIIYSTLFNDLNFSDVNNGRTFSNDPATLLKDYYEDATFYTLHEIYNENYTGPGSAGYRTRAESTYSMSWDDIRAALNITNDPRDEYDYEEAMVSSLRTFYTNNLDNMPYSYSSPVYYDVVTETKGNIYETGKTVYTYNTVAAPYNNPSNSLPFGIVTHCDGIYSPHCEWAYGHLVSQVDYKSQYGPGPYTYEPVRTVINKYKLNVTSYADLNMRYFANRTNAVKNMALLDYIDSHWQIPDFFVPETGGMEFGGYVVLDSSIVTTHYSSGDVVESTSYIYDESNLLPSKVTTVNSDGIVHRTENDYSSSYCSILENQNRINSLINKRSYVNGVLQETDKYIYKTWTTDNNLVALEKIQTQLYGGSLEDRIVYSGYSNGNPTEVSKKNDVKHTYVWGYNDQHPVAEFINYSKSQVDGNSSLTNYLNQLKVYKAITNSTQRSNVKDINNNIRSQLPANVLVTTITYDPMVGITSKAGPDGRTTFYEYDAFGRLKAVRNNDGEIVSQNEYNFAQ